MTALLAILGLGAACGLWVLVQRQADRVLPGNPGVVRDCKGCPQPPEICGPGTPTTVGEPMVTTPTGRTVGAGLDPARVGESPATIPSGPPTSCHRHPSGGTS